MGRPRVHDDRTAALLLKTAESIVETGGLSFLSLRRLADDAGVSTRAVYSLFGSKEALVGALGGYAFEWLGQRLAAIPFTDDPASDLVEAGASAFRSLVVEHPVLFQIGVQATWPPEIRARIDLAANEAWGQLTARTGRLASADAVGSQTSHEVAVEFHALCEGLASMEARGLLGDMSDGADPAVVWRRALRALVTGLAARLDSARLDSTA